MPTVDPQLEPILEFFGPTKAMEITELTPQEVRAAYGAALPQDNTGLSRVEDITVGDLPARLYEPEGWTKGGPAVVFFHGGGWVIGSLDSHHNTVARLAAESGCLFISVDYRLAPEHPAPAAAEDAYAATKWVAEHADRLGVDASRLAVAGDSAGGNLAAVVALTAWERGGPPLAFQLLIYPVVDVGVDYASHVENAEGPLLKTAAMRYYERHYLGDLAAADAGWQVAPIRAKDHSGLPPAFVITAELDPLRDEGMAYADKLQEAGVAAKATCYPGMVHGFFGFPVDRATEARKDAVEALRAALKVG